MNFTGIIPARYASSRFPGKPLALIGGKPMIQRVYEQAKKALSRVVVATDDQRIYDCVRSFGGEVVMTRSDHRCGTERCVEAWNKIRGNTDDTDAVIVNIQGDEPFIQPEQIEAVCHCFEGKDGTQTDIATLVRPFTENDTLQDLENPNTPKVVFTDNMRAILFSRSVIPYLRGIDKHSWLAKHRHYGHIGLYAYRACVLKQITQLPPSPLETAESLEQLRWLENGYNIQVAVSRYKSIGIDTPDDLEKANQMIIN